MVGLSGKAKPVLHPTANVTTVNSRRLMRCSSPMIIVTLQLQPFKRKMIIIIMKDISEDMEQAEGEAKKVGALLIETIQNKHLNTYSTLTFSHLTRNRTVSLLYYAYKIVVLLTKMNSVGTYF